MARWFAGLLALAPMVVVACGDDARRALSDAGAGGPDAPLDAMSDAAPDAPSDGPLPDAPSDGPLPDGPLPDGPLPDGPLPDGPLPDGPLPDGPLPDGPLPDGPLPDGPLPDAPAPDAPSDGPAPTPVINVRLADTVVDAPGATGTGFGDPTLAVNGVRGAGRRAGSLDVFARGYTSTQPGQNDHITLAWSNGRLQNGPGPDLAVFENPFLVGAGTFMDLIIVEVSLDGVEFRALAHQYTAADQNVYRNDPSLWVGFAGRTPVLLHVDNNPVDPFDTAAAGGDVFDLDTVVGDDAVARSIRAEGVRFIRLVSAPARTNPLTRAPYVHDAAANGADIDGVYGRYLTPE